MMNPKPRAVVTLHHTRPQAKRECLLVERLKSVPNNWASKARSDLFERAPPSLPHFASPFHVHIIIIICIYATVHIYIYICVVDII